MVSEIVTMAIGFFCGIFGSIIVYEYQQTRTNKENEKRIKQEYKKNLISKLDEILETIDRETSSENINYDEYKRDIYVLSKDLTSLISHSPEELNTEIYLAIKDTIAKLRELSKFFIGLDNHNEIIKESTKIYEYIMLEVIQKTRTNNFYYEKP